MNPRTTTILAIVVLIGMGFILFLQMATTLFPSKEAIGFLVPGNIRGTALIYKGTPYTLNFEQQKEFITLFNRAVPIGNDGLQLESANGLEGIVVYFFAQPDLTLRIVGRSYDNLIFDAPTWNSNGYMRDVSLGEMFALLSSAHD